MSYYYLKDSDVIRVGDEWTTGGSTWNPCRTSLGWINSEYNIDNMSGWKVRRPMKTTKLGNVL